MIHKILKYIPLVGMIYLIANLEQDHPVWLGWYHAGLFVFIMFVLPQIIAYFI